jgi:pyruvate kinase
MSRIALEVEKARGDMHDIPLRVLSSEISAYLSRAAVEGAIKLDAEVIIADSETGKTIRNMAGYRGRKVIHAVCYYPQVMRQMSLLFGVHAHLLDSSQRSAFVGPVLNELLGRGLVELEDLIVVVGGTFGFKHGKSFIEISSARNLIEAMNS